MDRIKNNVIWIIIASIFAIIVSDGVRYALFKINELSPEITSLAYWGDLFWIRIIVSLVGLIAGSFVIGSHFKNSKNTSLFLGGLVSLFWIAVFVFSIKLGISEELSVKLNLLPIIITILAPISAWFGWNLGKEYLGKFDREKSIFNIKWYHWIWIFPLYLNKVIAVPLFNLLALWQVDIAIGPYAFLPILGIFNLNFLGALILRAIVFGMFIGFVYTIMYVYEKLSSKNKIGVKHIFGIIGSVLLLNLIFMLFLAGY